MKFRECLGYEKVLIMKLLFMSWEEDNMKGGKNDGEGGEISENVQLSLENIMSTLELWTQEFVLHITT